MALPIGFLPDLSGADVNIMLPVSMQIVGPLHGEDKILKVGYAYEKMFDWRKEWGKRKRVGCSILNNLLRAVDRETDNILDLTRVTAL
jgi:hypothetical protein